MYVLSRLIDCFIAVSIDTAMKIQLKSQQRDQQYVLSSHFDSSVVVSVILHYEV